MARRNIGLLLVLQGAIGIIWWILLYRSPTVRNWFVADAGWPVARSLVVADVIGFGLGSVIVGIGILRNDRWASVALTALTAVVAYATLVSFAWVLEPVDRWLGAFAMLGSLGATMAANVWVKRQ
jgi:hypothetical protein